MTGGGWLLALIVTVGVAAAVFAWPRLEGEAPAIEPIGPLQLGVEGTTVPLTISDSGSGLRTLSAKLVRGGDAPDISLAAKTFRGSLMWGGTPSGRRQELDLEIDPQKLSLADGEASLVVVARDWSWRSGLDGNEGRLEVPVIIDTQPPRVSLESGLTYIYRGGSGAVAYRVSEPDAKSGVRVGDATFSGYPLNGDPKRRIALFAIPVTSEGKPQAVVFAADASGNESQAKVPIHVLSRKFKESAVSLPTSFLEDVVPALAEQHGIDSSDPMVAFQKINAEMRASNEEKIRSLLGDSSPEQLWEGGFEQLRNSKVTSRFAESRHYKIGGRPVSQARHYGFDLASASSAPVTASNAGVVKFAGDLGIYGNCVLVDHGLGLGSLYGHLSVIDVKEGQQVAKGERLGATGSTGLAGGDHLHFAILVGATYVDPIEWWDPKWVQSHVEVRMGGQAP